MLIKFRNLTSADDEVIYAHTMVDQPIFVGKV